MVIVLEFMTHDFDLQAELSAGKKIFKVVFENDGYTLIESGSIAAIIKNNGNGWKFTSGSYTDEDAKLVGKLIEEQLSKENHVK